MLVSAHDTGRGEEGCLLVYLRGVSWPSSVAPPSHGHWAQVGSALLFPSARSWPGGSQEVHCQVPQRGGASYSKHKTGEKRWFTNMFLLGAEDC